MEYLIGAIVVVLVAAALVASVAVVRPFENAVVMTMGRSKNDVRGPGIVVHLPVLQQVVRVDMRERSTEIERTRESTTDGVSVGVSGRVNWQVEDPGRVVLELAQPAVAVPFIIGGAFRNAVRVSTRDEVSDRVVFSSSVREAVDGALARVGVLAASVEVDPVLLEDADRWPLTVGGAQQVLRRDPPFVAESADGERHTP